MESSQPSKRSRSSSQSKKAGSKKVQKPVKPAKKPLKEPKPKKIKAEKPAKSEKPTKSEKLAKPEKANDLLQEAARRFGEDLFSTEEGGVASKSEPKPTSITPKLSASQLGDANLMELRECLYRFKSAATATPFSPGKFPSALRPLLNECVCVALRAFKPTTTEPLPGGLCPALASFLPFSVSALTKLLQKKILKTLKESIESGHMARMYELWPALIIKRLSEENSITGPEEASPEKKSRLKFTDEMRQLLFDILRAEIDSNNLAATCNLLSQAESAHSEDSGILNVFKVQSELNLRKSVYAKLASISGLPPGLISTGDLSKEFGAHKRKHDKKLSKAAAECFFGEEAIEALLKPKVIEVASTPVEPTETVEPVNDFIPPVNPLINLFDDPMEE